MRFWFEHSSEVSLREQIVAQVTLGILCAELEPGERLPSIRELARRFDLHPNTVSAGYRQLEAEGWVESRKGSGVFVRPRRPAATEPDAIFARLIANLFEHARRLGIPETQVVERIRAHVEPRMLQRLLLIEPDPELRTIVAAELAELAGFTGLPLEACGFDESAARSSGALVLALPSKHAQVKTLVPGCPTLMLKVRSVPASLAEHLPPAEARGTLLIGIASRWPEFLRFARTMLVAAGIDSEALVVRDAREPAWQEGLDAATVVLCDLATAQRLAGLETIVSRILANSVAADLRSALFTTK